MDPLRERITRSLAELSAGGQCPNAPAELLPAVYDELRRLARGYLSRERAHHTLQPTALVHEAYERLVDQSRVDWKGRSHFMGVAALAMRRLLVDYARERGRLKRGGDQQRVTLDAAALGPEHGELDLPDWLNLEQALSKLAELDPRAAQVMELRYFAGLTAQEAADHLGVSKRSVDADANHARAWLLRELSEGNGS